MSNLFTRRRFLVTAAAAASTVLGSSLNLESVWAAPLMRRNLGLQLIRGLRVNSWLIFP